MKNIILSLVLACLLVTSNYGQETGTTSQAQLHSKTHRIDSAQLSLIQNVILSSRDPGILDKVLIREGDSVSEKQTIALLDREAYAQQALAAESEWRIAQRESQDDADLRYAEISEEVNERVLSRSNKAVEQFAKAISETELERLHLELKRATFGKQQAKNKLHINQLKEELKQAQLAISKLQLKNRGIGSPIDGMVVQVFHQPGEWINSGDPIARIINLKRLRVKCLCDAKSINPHEISKEATFVAYLNDKEISIPAKIVFVSPEIDPVEQDFAVWAEVENDGNLRPGLVGTLILAASE